MAQTYTLEEAAGRLAMPAEEFKRRLKDEWKDIRSFRDGATLRFRAVDIDELARMLGEQSDPGLQLGSSGSGVDLDRTDPGASSSDDFLLAPDPPSKGGSSNLLGKNPPSSAEIEFVLTPDEKPASGHKKGKSSLKPPSDSDIRMDPAAKAGNSVNLNAPTEELELDLSGPGSAIIKPTSSSKMSAPKSSNRLGGPPSGKLSGPPSGKFSGPPSGRIPSPSGKISPADSSSEFELNLDADSDSFELNLAADSSDEVDLGGLDLGPANDNRGGLSGINLGKPSDSGLSLEPKKPKSGPKSGPKPASKTPSKLGGPKSSKIVPRGPAKSSNRLSSPASSDSDLDFELSMDPGPTSGGRPTRSGGSGGRAPIDDSSSEFELTLDDESDNGPKTKVGAGGRREEQGDIFETDFDLPALDEESGSEVVAVDSDNSSDFDLAISEGDAIADEESASQVVMVDDEDMLSENGGIAVETDDDVLSDIQTEEGPSASKALRNVRRDEETDDEDRPVRTVAQAPARWGALPAVILLPSLLVTFFGAIMSFELLRGMWGYHQPTKPGNLIVRGVADALSMKVSD